MDVIEKLRIMLPHWIEHNRSHQQEFSGWAEQVTATDTALADQLSKAIRSLADAGGALEKALKLTGGSLSGVENAHGHHHHH